MKDLIRTFGILIFLALGVATAVALVTERQFSARLQAEKKAAESEIAQLNTDISALWASIAERDTTIARQGRAANRWKVRDDSLGHVIADLRGDLSRDYTFTGTDSALAAAHDRYMRTTLGATCRTLSLPLTLTTGEHGTWMCRPVSEYYLNLTSRVVPGYMRLVEVQDEQLAVKDSVIASQDTVIRSQSENAARYQSIITRERQKTRVERGLRESFEHAYKVEKWKFRGALILIAGAAVLVVSQ